jgi:hypothetical protein
MAMRELRVVLKDRHWEIIDGIVEQAGAMSVDNLVAAVLQRACEDSAELASDPFQPAPET